ncbi:MAG: hypothetical protein JXA89_20180, partial [Anaerolineae bacterium]|nr:hypothetical protein [Anaerolineae bacterium]
GRPELPFVYSDEVWCGIEYQVASHLIYEGFVEQGLRIVKGVRDRHDGERRNPWNEFECGSHYARSMASWGLITALSGFEFDVPNGRIGFAPRFRVEDGDGNTIARCFWSLDSGWGSFAQTVGVDGCKVELSVVYGTLVLKELGLGSVKGGGAMTASVDGQTIPARWVDGAAVFEDVLALSIGQTLAIRLG